MAQSSKPVLVAPSILAADFARLRDECRAVQEQGADWIHVDVMDGHFVPNLTFGPNVVKALRPHVDGVMDVHLMIAPVEPFVAAFADAGADILTAHAEAGPHLHRTLQSIRAAGMKAGVALNPGTPAEAVAEVLDLVDLVCVMTVNPGFGGQSYLDMGPKIARLADLIDGREIRIEVDGGIGPGTAARSLAAGADVLVAGSAIFAKGSPDRPEGYGEAIRALRDAR